jgi:hypothetical protein
MTDLRIRIARVLHQRQVTADAPEGWVWTWEQESEGERQGWLETADAVIRELGLHQETWPAGMSLRSQSSRYVTDWRNDE